MRKCEWCKKDFEPPRRCTKYCSSECRKAAVAKAATERAEKRKLKDLENARKKLERNADKLSISEVNALAREEGLTYGKYLAKHGLY
jgi:ribosomal protein L20